MAFRMRLSLGPAFCWPLGPGFRWILGHLTQYLIHLIQGSSGWPTMSPTCLCSGGSSKTPTGAAFLPDAYWPVNSRRLVSLTIYVWGRGQILLQLLFDVQLINIWLLIWWITCKWTPSQTSFYNKCQLSGTTLLRLCVTELQWFVSKQPYESSWQWPCNSVLVTTHTI